MPEGMAYFPGVERVDSASATLSHGITPGRIRLAIAPQQRIINEIGDFVMTFRDVKIVFKDCKVDAASLRRDASGYVVELSLVDRRWKWRFPTIYGTYNVRGADGKILKDDDAGKAGALFNSERSPQHLARLLLDAMGEPFANVGDLPNDSRPGVEWDFDEAAAELARLTQGLGCRIVLGFDDKVSIRRAGVGSQLPNIPYIDRSASIDPPELPDEIGVATGRVRYQADLELEAVGLDKDGQIKPIDELSYKPNEGWDSPDAAIGQFIGMANPTLKALAVKSVYRWFRVKLPFKLPGFDFGQIEKIEQIFLHSEQNDQAKQDGVMKPKAAVVYGIYAPGKDSAGLGRDNSAALMGPLIDDLDQRIVGTDFQIDAGRGLVMFAEPVYQWIDKPDPDGGPALRVPSVPELRLRTAVNARDPKTRTWVRYVRHKKTGAKNGTARQIEKHDEILYGIVPTYDAQFNVEKLTDNKKDVEKECDYYIKALMDAYQSGTPESATYPGLVPVPLDGAIQAVTLSMGPGGWETTVQRNQDLGSPTTIPYRNRRALEKQRGADQKALANNPRQAADNARLGVVR